MTPDHLFDTDGKPLVPGKWYRLVCVIESYGKNISFTFYTGKSQLTRFGKQEYTAWDMYGSLKSGTLVFYVKAGLLGACDALYIGQGDRFGWIIMESNLFLAPVDIEKELSHEY